MSVLIAWELGAGLGHLARLAPLAAACLEAGCRVHLALPPHAPLAWLRAKLPAGWAGHLTASAVPRLATAGPLEPTHTLADVLALLGLGNPAAVAEAALRWSRLLAKLRPDLVIADFAPMAVLAARGRVPILVVGNGYTVPPAGDRLPPIAPWVREVPAESRCNEERVLTALGDAARGVRAAPPANLAALFHGDATHVGTLPQLDPYHRHRGGGCRFPYTVEPPGEPQAWEARPREAFVYLPQGHPSLAAVLATLAEQNIAAVVHTGPGAAELPGPAARMLHDTPSLADLLPRVRLVVHHAGLGTAHAALLAGTPQVVLPRRLEHRVTAHALWELGVAAEPAGDSGLAETNAKILCADGPARHAEAWAARLRQLATPAVSRDLVLADAFRLAGATA